MPNDADDTAATSASPDSADTETRPVQPGQDPGLPVAPVPAPGHDDSSAGAGVRTAQGASPEGGDATDDAGDTDSSPGAWTAIAAPGKPDGEVDTRS